MNFIKNIFLILLFILLISFSQSCTTSSFGQHADSLFLVDHKVDYTYNLKKPQEKYFLPYVLEEISGLTYKNPASVLAVDDESGKIFEYDLEKREIVHSITFYKADDYEGIELVGKDVYVLKNDGDIFHFSYIQKKETISRKHETDLHSDNDTEGLGYDPSRNLLLIACKEQGHIGKDKIDGRAFYSFDPVSKQLSAKPIFIVGPAQLEAFWETHNTFDYEKERIKFKPSAIATHPISGHYYILSSVGKMMVVVNKKGQILATYPISPRVLGQPEGICFSPTGDLYISSEGEGDRGYILKFDMKASS